MCGSPETEDICVVVDILVPTNEESLNELVGTLAAIQSVKWYGCICIRAA